MECEVLYTDEFGAWWESLTEAEQESVAVTVGLLEMKGVTLPFPYSSGIQGSRHGNMRELRIQHAGDPYRVLYIFDPQRKAVLLIGAKKGGNALWYEKAVPIADRIYDQYRRTLERRE